VFKPVLTPARHHNWTEPLRKMEADALAQLDAEPRYSTGTLLSYCGRKDAAVRLNRTILPTPPCNPTRCLRASEKVRSSTNCCLPPNSARIDFWRNAAETNNPRWQLFRLRSDIPQASQGGGEAAIAHLFPNCESPQRIYHR